MQLLDQLAETEIKQLMMLATRLQITLDELVIGITLQSHYLNTSQQFDRESISCDQDVRGMIRA